LFAPCEPLRKPRFQFERGRRLQLGQEAGAIPAEDRARIYVNVDRCLVGGDAGGDEPRRAAASVSWSVN
jgi:hypothetical protein